LGAVKAPAPVPGGVVITGSYDLVLVAFLSSNGIALPTWAEKPGCRQARSLRARSSEHVVAHA